MEQQTSYHMFGWPAHASAGIVQSSVPQAIKATSKTVAPRKTMTTPMYMRVFNSKAAKLIMKASYSVRAYCKTTNVHNRKLHFFLARKY